MQIHSGRLINQHFIVFHSYKSVSQCIQILKLSLIIAPLLLPHNCFCAPAHLVPVTQTSALHFTPAENDLRVTNACAHQGNFRSFSSFLFVNVQICSGQAESFCWRSSSSACFICRRVHGRTYVRARGPNTHARTHRRIYRWPIYAGPDYGGSLANTVGTVRFFQLNHWSLWLPNCCSSRPGGTRRRCWLTANANISFLSAMPKYRN